MKIGILTFTPSVYTSRRLREAAATRDCEVKTFLADDFSLCVGEGSEGLRYRGKEMEHLDALLPRIASSGTSFGTGLVRQFEKRGVINPNPSDALEIAHDKFRSVQLLANSGIAVPRTAFARNVTDIKASIKEVGGTPVVIKLLHGSQGVGVMLAESQESAEAIVEALQAIQQPVLIQQFIAESRGKDVRAFVVGDKVVAAMRRVASGDEFRSNLHRGGSAEPVKISAKQADAAVRAARAIGVGVAGIDLLEGKKGPIVMEVNSSPGLEGIEETTGVDVAAAIIDYFNGLVPKKKRPSKRPSILSLRSVSSTSISLKPRVA